MIDFLKVFVKGWFEKVEYDKSADKKKHANIPSMQKVDEFSSYYY